MGRYLSAQRPEDNEERLAVLVRRWERLRGDSQAVTAEELCRECPELAPELARRIAALGAEDDLPIRVRKQPSGWARPCAITLLLFLVMMLSTVALALVIVLASAVWATVDSVCLQMKKYKGGIDHPALVFISICLLWIVFFPMYLVTRARLLNGELKLKRKYQDSEAAPRSEPGRE